MPFLLAFFPALRRLASREGLRRVCRWREGRFQVAVMIIPHVVGMLTAVFMFRSAGCIDAMAHFLRPVLDTIGFPSETVAD